jgi:hypothetical protein
MQVLDATERPLVRVYQVGLAWWVWGDGKNSPPDCADSFYAASAFSTFYAAGEYRLRQSGTRIIRLAAAAIPDGERV